MLTLDHAWHETAVRTLSFPLTLRYQNPMLWVAKKGIFSSLGIVKRVFGIYFINVERLEGLILEDERREVERHVARTAGMCL
jgi:hypothetical protein